jgi:hypothetical protein
VSRAQANWHVEAVADLDDEPDPFAVPIEEVGKRIDLSDARGLLELRIVELVMREGICEQQGITCALKLHSDTCCHACPVSQAHNSEDPLSILCRIGREQEKVLTEMAALTMRNAPA